MNKCIIYCRKSTEEESRQIQSLETQENILTEYASRNSLEVIEIIKESKSATNDGNRPQFDYMLQKIRDNEADTILVVRPDRLTRNYIEFGFVIKLLEQGKLKSVITPTQTYTAYHEMILYFSVDMLTATNEPRKLSARVREGMRTKLEKGEYPASAPIGYINQGKNIVPTKPASRYVKRGFELYSTGRYSLKEVTNILYKEGFRTKKARNKVVKSVIHKMLQNPVYYGMTLRQGVLYQGKYKPIISKALFDRTQDVFNNKIRPKHKKHKFIYRDLFYCEVCGCKITADRKVKKSGKVYNYYYCTNGKKRCEQRRKYTNETKVEKLIAEKLSKFKLNKEMAKLSLDAYYLSEKKKFENKSTTNTELLKRRAEIKDEMKTLAKKNVRGIVDDDTAKSQNEDYKSELVDIEKTLKKLQKDLDPKTFELCYEWLEPLTSLDTVFIEGNPSVKSNLTKSLLSNLSMKNCEIVTVEYNKPFSRFENINESDDFEVWRRG